jgi:putative flippase GtrA
MKEFAWVQRVGTYTIVSAAVTAVDYSIFIMLVKLAGFTPVTANICSWAVAVGVAYCLHSVFTFDKSISLAGFLGYVAVCLSTLILGTSIIAVWAIYVTPIAAKIASTILVFTASFALSRMTVFRTV